ncbi:hypothetical protein V6N11_042374 [Hibiscus sabdariffa]|uniref:Proton pump-interactor 1 n=1 Tax=Hibiscus sabdariffa TaxID=183260 RepID=A0ABR2QW83_9ROSI
MGVEIVGSNMARVAEVDKLFLLDKENVKLDHDPVHDDTIKVVSDPNVPTDAVDEWPVAKQIRSFYFVRYRLYDNPEIKAKIDQADKELQKWNRARFKITDELKARRSDRAELLSQVRALNVDFDQYKEVLGEKRKEIEPLQQALGKLRTNNYVFGGLCSSEEELNAVIHCLQYRIQHESIPLVEEKQLLREIKRLEGTREMVMANAAMRAKIQDSMGQKEAIQDQVKVRNFPFAPFEVCFPAFLRKEQHAVQSKKKLIKDKLTALENRIDSLQEELKDVTEKRDKAYEDIQELRKQRDEQNVYFFQSRSLLNKAKIVAAKKDIKALEELAAVEAEKFMALWNGNKAFRDDYVKRILTSLDSRQLSRDGRIRNPDEKPLVTLTPEAMAETILKPSLRQPKEEAKPQPGTRKKVQKDAETKEREKKARKKAATSTTAAKPEEPAEPAAEASESEKVDVNADAPIPAPVSGKDKVQKENNIRSRNRTKGPDALPRAILRRKKSANYGTWAALAALGVLILLVLVYHYIV